MIGVPRPRCLLVCLLCLAYGTLLNAAPPDKEKQAQEEKPAVSQFLRVQRDAQGQPTALETATVRYVPASGEGDLVVDLIGVVHIADRTYYQQLNKQFERYDALLYELVAPPGTRIPRGGKRSSDNPIAMLQQLGKTMLELESQTELVDYSKKNFVHADLSPEQMAEAIRRRGDTGLTLFLSVMSDLLRQQNLQEMRRKEVVQEEPELDLLGLLFDPGRATKLKRIMAEQLVDFASPAGGLGATLNTILITDRNQAAMKVFQRELAKGKKKIAIFYGVAHMPDFEERLQRDFGLKRQSEQWLTAWNLGTRRARGDAPLPR
jgi:hypothetical protein